MTQRGKYQATRQRAKQRNDVEVPQHHGPLALAEENTVHEIVGWEGPLPPPQALGAFSDVVENGAERVFRQFEAEAEHRRQMTKETLRVQARDLMVGKILAFLFVMSMIGTAIFAISKGYPTAAVILGTTVIGTVVLAFVRVSGAPNPTEAKQKKRQPSSGKSPVRR